MAEKMTAERAFELTSGQGFHCSQVVVMHGCEVLGMDKDLLLKDSGGFGGGCFHGDICGAVTGALMMLGAVYGYNQPGQKEQNAILVGKIREFEKRFEEKYGALTCTALLGGYNITIPEQAKIIMEQGLNKNCPAMIAGACDILDDMLAEK